LGVDIFYIIFGLSKGNFYNMRVLGHFHKLLISISVKVIILNLKECIPPINIHTVSLRGAKRFSTYPNDRRGDGAERGQYVDETVFNTKIVCNLS
jgi:hypothetical protein